MTLIEMIVVIGLLVLLMSIVVTIFATSTTAVTTAQVNQELDQQLRRLDTVIRNDLQGITARMTPPLNPQDGLGYFTYIENQFSDAQGEDSDDCVGFTTRAPAGQPFTGRMWVQFPSLPLGTPFADPALSAAAQQLTMPMTVTSEFAEVIYFLRGENLYRRVLLIAPQLKDSSAFYNRGLGLPHNVGWSGVPANELAFRSAILGMFEPGVNPPRPVAMSWQGVNDISSRPGSGVPPSAGVPANPLTFPNAVPVPNSLGDLTNRQNRFAHPRHTTDYMDNGQYPMDVFVPDGVPDDKINMVSDGIADFAPTLYPEVFGKPARWLDGTVIPNELLAAVLPPAGANSDRMAFPFIFPGMYSQVNDSSGALGPITSTPQPLGALHGMPRLGPAGILNHSPVPQGDSILVPSTVPADNQLESWWGFPTWRETMSSSWLDPIWRLNGNGGAQAPGLSRGANFRALPPLATTSLATPPFSDGLGYTGANNFIMPASVWQDDLIATGVRSFDIKVYDPNVQYFNTSAGAFPYGASYVDLGYATTLLSGAATPNFRIRALETFGHEGRIPPLLIDFRSDPNWPTQNVGDDAGTINRLRRVYDTWSTDYSNVASRKFNQPPGSVRPSLPSYPAPYTQPLTGIQIQIRIVNPRNDRVKTLTIRQDFSDKL